MSGVLCAWALTQYSPHIVTLYEQGDVILRYAKTIDFLPPGIPEKCTVDFLPETRVPVDVRPFYYNEKFAPNMDRLFDELRVDTEYSELDFGMTQWEIDHTKGGRGIRDKNNGKDIGLDGGRSDAGMINGEPGGDGDNSVEGLLAERERELNEQMNEDNLVSSLLISSEQRRKILRQSLWLPRRTDFDLY
ncbi:hypothetical protein AX774_g4378 [Zancudomyces culisetae]|uniref:Uncharacterized protein n=1 Tax=Zancudomyces culisetae TaxID=1213189 RepID=A0A1R1PMH0_ZANCU|nr:hypothetical protein AX774_g4378 [Zancudomyces culisetae]|eukprot:OMH82155.1 hypothetical protein AX774_g4378 [Zancudomyces culisetae]